MRPNGNVGRVTNLKPRVNNGGMGEYRVRSPDALTINAVPFTDVRKEEMRSHDRPPTITYLTTHGGITIALPSFP